MFTVRIYFFRSSPTKIVNSKERTSAPPNNSHRKETKTASEERKEPEINPFHESYREERVERPKHRIFTGQDFNGSAASAYSNASSRRKPEDSHIEGKPHKNVYKD
ncbi:hypothetical protein B6U84_02650 [Candidatus Bathyarchaeota archaeon ex4484_40]|nr:MAG: hypothetical protein B6U84_02650 [Candidatus Bathyarchaeota archaeon ex4484_40]